VGYRYHAMGGRVTPSWGKPIVFKKHPLETYVEKLSKKESAKWQIRYITASDTTLMYFKNLDSAKKKDKPRGEIPLDESTVLEKNDDKIHGKPYCFSLILDNGKGRKYTFSTATEEEKDKWLAHFEAKCSLEFPEWLSGTRKSQDVIEKWRSGIPTK